ncbi:B3 domain-containing transcription factor ABI3-like [Silene latifolia]|uniref:B3 domain-containing transcription factor ABI3-like n=1 Tax=Silene latifolia TaxID=37657 RepID=UPI003D77E774
MKDLSMHGEDLNGFDVFSNNQEVVVVVGKEDEEIWFETASQHHQNSFINTHNNNNNNNNNDNNNNNNSEYVDLDVSDPSSLFYAEFPALPDFPCKSSSSSSNRVASKRFFNSTATSSSSASTASSGVASWAVLNSDADHDPNSNPQNQQGGLVLDDVDVDECMDMMENLGCMDLLESTDICWDPSPLFQNESQNSQSHSHDHLRHEQQQQPQQPVDDANEEEHLFRQFMLQNECKVNTNNTTPYVDLGQSSGAAGGTQQPEDDLAMVFFEWLKSNKETVSAEDLRNIKIKKSTIESAAKRLGGGKEGMKQLLKLILQWVQNHHLHNNLNPNPNPNPNTDFHCMNPPTWSMPDMGPMVPIAPSPGFMMPQPHMGGDPYGYPPPPIPGQEYHSWAQPVAQVQYGMGPYGSYPDPGFGGYPAPYPGGLYYHPGPGEGLVRVGSSATKEARKKRMARQRRLFTHQHHRNHHNLNHNHQGNNNQTAEMSGGLGHGNCGVAAPHPSHANWVYWPQHQLPPVPPPPHVIQSVSGSGHIVGQVATQQDRAGLSGFPRQVGGVDKKQGWKTEKNLRFLLQKVLKQSDVGNLGRIVLPKKEAEMHLPELEARDGIPIAMEDIGTSRVWNMRYRFWPNNKSRMYLLENTGDFVRSNGLQEGDFIVIYSDVKCGKYMIRGVKVRPSQQGAKPETLTKSNKPSKTQKTQGSSTPSSLNMMQ